MFEGWKMVPKALWAKCNEMIKCDGKVCFWNTNRLLQKCVAYVWHWLLRDSNLKRPPSVTARHCCSFSLALSFLRIRFSQSQCLWLVAGGLGSYRVLRSVWSIFQEMTFVPLSGTILIFSQPSWMVAGYSSSPELSCLVLYGIRLVIYLC